MAKRFVYRCLEACHRNDIDRKRGWVHFHEGDIFEVPHEVASPKFELTSVIDDKDPVVQTEEKPEIEEKPKSSRRSKES